MGSNPVLSAKGLRMMDSLEFMMRRPFVVSGLFCPRGCRFTIHALELRLFVELGTISCSIYPLLD
jgi:hypothetical protein